MVAATLLMTTIAVVAVVITVAALALRFLNNIVNSSEQKR